MRLFFDRFIEHLESRYPEAARALDMRARLNEKLFSPHKVRLPANLATQAQAIVRAFFALRSLPERERMLSALAPEVPDPGNFSVLMSYDFHPDDQGHLRLIEINTNASMALMTDLLNEVQGVRNPFSNDFRGEILECFREEARLAGRDPHTVAIVDEHPVQQRLYAEFELYAELFRRAGFKVLICDPDELAFAGDELRAGDEKIDIVYNRHTDFYFATDACAPLRSAVLARAACVSPHPHEYRLLADKARLMELSRPGALDELALSPEDRHRISTSLLRTLAIKEFSDPQKLWAERKKWFFKTENSFGGKAAYRGSSISHPIFTQILAGPYLAQEYVPAPSMKLGDDEFKWDLRFFVYKDRVQLACARLYKGQMTNSQTPGGGIAAIDWVE